MCSPLLSLPNELLHEAAKIVLYDSAKPLNTLWDGDYHSLALANKRLHKVMQGTVGREFPKQLVLRVDFGSKPQRSLWPAWTLDKTIRWLKKHYLACAQVEDLHFTAVSGSCEDDPVAQVTRHLRQLQHLTVQGDEHNYYYEPKLVGQHPGTFGNLPESIRSLHLSKTYFTPLGLDSLEKLHDLQTVTLNSMQCCRSGGGEQQAFYDLPQLSQVKTLHYHSGSHWYPMGDLDTILHVFFDITTLTLLDLNFDADEIIVPWPGCSLPGTLSKLTVGVTGVFGKTLIEVFDKLEESVTPERLPALRSFKLVDQGLQASAMDIDGGQVSSCFGQLCNALGQIDELAVALQWDPLMKNYSTVSRSIIEALERIQAQRQLNPSIQFKVEGPGGSSPLGRQPGAKANGVRYKRRKPAVSRYKKTSEVKET